jgi:hypothetical protein
MYLDTMTVLLTAAAAACRRAGWMALRPALAHTYNWWMWQRRPRAGRLRRLRRKPPAERALVITDERRTEWRLIGGTKGQQEKKHNRDGGAQEEELLRLRRVTAKDNEAQYTYE